MSATCGARAIWDDIPPHGVRLTCQLATGHGGDHAGSIEYLTKPEPAGATS